MGSLRQDLHFGWRLVARKPTFALLVVLTLALGLGVNIAVFSLFYGVILRPLPYERPAELVRVWQSIPANGLDRAPVSWLNFVDWGKQNDAFSGMACFKQGLFLLSGGDAPAMIQGGLVSARTFQVLGAVPQLGRAFLPGEDEPGAAPVVVLSDDLWRRDFNADPAVLKRTLKLDGNSYAVVGVMPRGFRFIDGAELWVPLVLQGPDREDRGALSLQVVARLKPGTSLESARAKMATVANRLAADYPSSNTGLGVTVTGLAEEIVGKIRPTLLALLGAVGLLLLAACTNVGNLLLVRNAERQGEIAVRMALGAGRPRVVRQILTESVIYGLLGGALGFVLARWMAAWMMHLNPDWIPRLQEVRFDLPVVAFSMVLAVGVGFLFGLLPVLQLGKADLAQQVHGGGSSSRNAGRTGGTRLRDILTVAEVALALVLLIGAGLMLKSLLRLTSVEPGYEPAHAVSVNLFLPAERYSDPALVTSFSDRLLERLAVLPGVSNVGIATSLPLHRRSSKDSYVVAGRPETQEKPPIALLDGVSPGFFAALGIPVLAGRPFGPADRPPAPVRVIVDKTLADLWWPAGEAIGKRLIVPSVSDQLVEVMGVAGAVKRFGLDADYTPQIYLPLPVAPRRALGVVVRTKGDPAALAVPIRKAVGDLDPELFAEVKTLREALDESLSQRRFNTRLIGIFGVLATVLATVGIYAVVAFSVALRTREIGIRIALGGSPKTVRGLVLGKALALSALGLGIGLAASWWATRFLASLLFEVATKDWQTFAGGVLLLFAVSFLASWPSAVRATRVDPVNALRGE